MKKVIRKVERKIETPVTPAAPAPVKKQPAAQGVAWRYVGSGKYVYGKRSYRKGDVVRLPAGMDPNARWKGMFTRVHPEEQPAAPLLDTPTTTETAAQRAQREEAEALRAAGENTAAAEE